MRIFLREIFSVNPKDLEVVKVYFSKTSKKCFDLEQKSHNMQKITNFAKIDRIVAIQNTKVNEISHTGSLKCEMYMWNFFLTFLPISVLFLHFFHKNWLYCTNCKLSQWCMQDIGYFH